MEELLGSYSISRISIEEYKVSFEIPNNCTYKITEKDGVYVVTIKQTEKKYNPTQHFDSYSFLTKTFKGVIHIEFNQNNGLDRQASAVRPKIIIDTNG